ncbi:uncharacterized protein PG998_002598 [Apiospora kogelbergensis]|uniref:uncharacterized protein n=1 Tax=Apiospora kogelbergensis TaxID=1337665 RepID=UPI003130D089
MHPSFLLSTLDICPESDSLASKTTMVTESPRQTESHELQDTPRSPPHLDQSSTPSAPAQQPIASGGPAPATVATQPGRLTRACGALGKSCGRRGEIILGTATVLALFITAISMWPTISAATDGRKAELIAEWTARKDFFETCETHNWTLAACEKAKGMQLEAPPNFDRTLWKRLFEREDRKMYDERNSLRTLSNNGGSLFHLLPTIPLSALYIFMVLDLI